MRLLNVSVVLAAALLFSDQAISCSVAQRADFAKAGYNKSEIESMCKGGGSTPQSTQTSPRAAGVAKDSPVAPLLGLWNQTSCEYWKNDTQLDLPCTPTGVPFFVEFKQGSFRLPSGEHGVEYLDAGLDAVDVKGLNGKWSFRFHKLAPDTITTFLPDKANDRQSRVILKRAGQERVDGAPLDSVASQVPTPPKTKDSAQTVLPGDIVPLKRGYYVSSNVPCNRASNATLSLYTGKSFGSNCKVVSNKKINDTTYAMKSKCDERGESLSLSEKYVILSPVEYKVIYEHGASQSRYCEQSRLPEPWRSNDISN